MIHWIFTVASLVTAVFAIIWNRRLQNHVQALTHAIYASEKGHMDVIGRYGMYDDEGASDIIEENIKHRLNMAIKRHGGRAVVVSWPSARSTSGPLK